MFSTWNSWLASFHFVCLLTQIHVSTVTIFYNLSLFSIGMDMRDLFPCSAHFSFYHLKLSNYLIVLLWLNKHFSLIFLLCFFISVVLFFLCICFSLICSILLFLRYHTFLFYTLLYYSLTHILLKVPIYTRTTIYMQVCTELSSDYQT